MALDAEWDEEMLKVEIAELEDLGFNLELTGFDVGELDLLKGGDLVEGLTDEDSVPDAPWRNDCSKLAMFDI